MFCGFFFYLYLCESELIQTKGVKRYPPPIAQCTRVPISAHTLCQDNCQLIVLAINCNHSVIKNNCN